MLRAPAVASLVFVSFGAFGQTIAPRMEFEVASIKLNKSGEVPAGVGIGRGSIDHIERPSEN
jgi:hypothetical protein